MYKQLNPIVKVGNGIFNLNAVHAVKFDGHSRLFIRLFNSNSDFEIDCTEKEFINLYTEWRNMLSEQIDITIGEDE